MQVKVGVWIGVWCVVASPAVFGQAGESRSAPTVTKGIPGVVAAGAKIQVLAEWKEEESGEGPIPMPDGSILFQLDAPFRVAKIDRNGHFSTYLDTGKNRVLGLAVDLKGRLLATQTGESAGIAILSPTRSMLVETFEGKALAGANDLVIDSKGGLYFTVNRGRGTAKGPAIDIPSVFYLRPDGKLLRVIEGGIKVANGVQLGPDGKTLYVADTPAEYIKAYDVQSDGTVTNGRDFAKLESVKTDEGLEYGSDGMAVDAAGRLYVGAEAGVQIYDTRGQLLGKIETPLKPRNLTFYLPDRNSLFIVARGGAYKIPMLAEGPRGRAK